MDELVQRLLTEQSECTLSWLTREGLPASTIVSFTLLEGRIAMTALEHAARVKAIRRNPHVAIVVSGSGSPVGHSRCVSIQGECEILNDQATRDRFFPLFSAAVLPGSRKGAEMMAKSMNTPENCVLLVTPRKWIPYDAQAGLERANSL
ncbi:MAG: pyridoxamine 5'-phosphate oxidase family protein [Myxococcota bacterium]